MEEIRKQKPAHTCSPTPDFRSTLNEGEPGRWFGPCGACGALGRLASAGRREAGSVLQAPRAWETQISVSDPEHPWDPHSSQAWFSSVPFLRPPLGVAGTDPVRIFTTD